MPTSLARSTSRWLRRYQRRHTRRNPASHDGTRTVALVAFTGLGAFGTHVAATQGVMWAPMQTWLHEHWPATYPANAAAAKAMSAAKARVAAGKAKPTPATPTAPGGGPNSKPESLSDFLNKVTAALTGAAGHAGAAPATSETKGTALDTGPGTDVVDGVVDGGGRRWTGIVDLTEWGAEGFAWEVWSGNVVTFREHYKVASLDGYPRDQRTPELAAKLASTWYLQQTNAVQAGTITTAEPPAGSRDPVDLGQVNAGAHGFAWDPVSGDIYSINPPYTRIGTEESQDWAVVRAYNYNNAGADVLPA